MKIYKFWFYGILLFTVLALFPAKLFAQITLPAPAADVSDIANINSRFQPLATYTPSMYLRTGLNLLLGVSGVVCFIFLLGGIAFGMTGPEKEASQRAGKAITGALIGLAIVFSGYALLYLPRVLFNIDLIQVVLSQIGTG
jgi:hypothetical protein